MKYQIRDAATGRIITGTLIKEYPKGITIDDDSGVRYYATTDRVIGPVEEKITHDLFAELT